MVFSFTFRQVFQYGNLQFYCPFSSVYNSCQVINLTPLQDKVRELEESSDNFLASTPNHSRGQRSLTVELDSISPPENIRRHLTADSRARFVELSLSQKNVNDISTL